MSYIVLTSWPLSGQSVNSSPYVKLDEEGTGVFSAFDNPFITPPQSPKSGPEGTAPSLPPCFVLSSTELGVFSKLVDFNNFEMSVVRSEGSCVAIRNLSPSTSINRSCAHGSASSGILFLLTLAWRSLPFDPPALISSSVSI